MTSVLILSHIDSATDQSGQLCGISRFTELRETFSSKVLGPGRGPNMILDLPEATQGQRLPKC